ncbi:MAG: hypothetical protein M0P13_09160 [Fibrobacteraceae bacterium]|nr:hypothetical protein [Fibrobacteraceae bacterium]
MCESEIVIKNAWQSIFDKNIFNEEKYANIKKELVCIWNAFSGFNENIESIVAGFYDSKKIPPNASINDPYIYIAIFLMATPYKICFGINPSNRKNLLCFKRKDNADFYQYCINKNLKEKYNLKEYRIDLRSLNFQKNSENSQMFIFGVQNSIATFLKQWNR